MDISSNSGVFTGLQEGAHKRDAAGHRCPQESQTGESDQEPDDVFLSHAVPPLVKQVGVPRNLRELFFAAAFVPLRDHFISASEHGPRPRAVCLADQTFALHDVQNRRRAAVADAQTPLQH